MLLFNQLSVTNDRIDEVFRRLDNGHVIPSQGIFFDGQVFDAHRFVSDLIRSAKQRVVLFDNYVDDTTLAMLDKRVDGVKAIIYTRSVTPSLSTDMLKHDTQYPPIEVHEFSQAHDRFLCIDDTVYHMGLRSKIWERNGLPSVGWKSQPSNFLARSWTDRFLIHTAPAPASNSRRAPPPTTAGTRF